MVIALTNSFVWEESYNFKSTSMLTTTDIAQVYDTILSIPGMSETVKIDLKMSRKNVLLLNRIIKRGLMPNPDEEASHLLGIMPEDSLEELTSMADDCLKKAGLIELSEKLKTFQ
jgi:hypothetical protein